MVNVIPKQYDRDHMNSLILPAPLAQLLPASLRDLAVGALYRRGEHLFSNCAKPEWMFYVVAGEIMLERSGAHGEHVVLQRRREGFVSEASLLVDAYHCDAVALEESTLIKLPITALRQQLQEDARFNASWMQTLNREIMHLRTQCQRLSFHSVQEKIIHLIQTEGHNGRYPIPTGVKTLAGELGVSHEALYRSIAELKKSGALERTDEALILTPKKR
jgi:CRP/FNR family transcriptional regulator, dissimilatory nitrate respiration regulator